MLGLRQQPREVRAAHRVGRVSGELRVVHRHALYVLDPAERGPALGRERGRDDDRPPARTGVSGVDLGRHVPPQCRVDRLDQQVCRRERAGGPRGPGPGGRLVQQPAAEIEGDDTVGGRRGRFVHVPPAGIGVTLGWGQQDLRLVSGPTERRRAVAGAGEIVREHRDARHGIVLGSHPHASSSSDRRPVTTSTLTPGKPLDKRFLLTPPVSRFHTCAGPTFLR